MNVKDIKYAFGTQFPTKSSGTCTIIKYENARNIYVMFEDGTLTKVTGGNLCSGSISNPNRPTVFGFGINDAGLEDSTDKRYVLWNSIIRRSYSEVYHKSKPSYKDVRVSEDWRRLSNFIKDIEKLPNFDLAVSENWELDKDLLGGDQKLYSNNTCCFLPRELNTLFTSESKKGLKKGVFYNKRLGKFTVSINRGGKVRSHIGVYKTEEEAHFNYCKEKQKHLDSLILKYGDKLPQNVKFKLKDWFIKQNMMEDIKVDN